MTILSQTPRQRVRELLCILAGGVFVLYMLVHLPHAPRTAAPHAILPPPPELSADIYFVRMVGSPDALFMRKEWKPHAPASLTKLMTALVADELLPEGGVIPFSEDAKTLQETGEKISPVQAGDEVSKKAALSLALVASYNDAARALAETAGRKLGGMNYAEGISRFMARVEERRQKLGMTASHFENPVGLDMNGHTATARDLATLVEYLWYNHPEILRLTRDAETTIETSSRRTYTIDATNELLKEFPAILAGKTGFTDNAQGALVLVYPTRLGKPAIIVLMDSHNRFGDGRKIINWIEKNVN